ncbi:hypothetical protein NQ314_003699 [Rhamnusium bicolor]|uniref:Uncharacterized protein n=1 Tax=Rhamnusium bicolor TaxID=1586634 RepID=A0AAV8ZL36_9CUCU|nr:hypothetical protein NQ314_003699 [Rhamnusium bicolor]
MLTSSGSDVLKENNNNNGSTSNLNHLSSPSANKDKEEQSFFTFNLAILKAEILWTLDLIETDFSMNSVNKSIPLFQEMFTDSEIAKNMKLGSTKASYIHLA